MSGKRGGDFLDRVFCRKADWHAVAYWRHPGWQGPEYPGRAAVPIPGPEPDSIYWCVEDSHPGEPHDFGDPDFLPAFQRQNGHVAQPIPNGRPLAGDAASTRISKQ